MGFRREGSGTIHPGALEPAAALKTICAVRTALVVSDWGI